MAACRAALAAGPSSSATAGWMPGASPKAGRPARSSFASRPASIGCTRSATLAYSACGISSADLASGARSMLCSWRTTGAADFSSPTGSGSCRWITIASAKAGTAAHRSSRSVSSRSIPRAIRRVATSRYWSRSICCTGVRPSGTTGAGPLAEEPRRAVPAGPSRGLGCSVTRFVPSLVRQRPLCRSYGLSRAVGSRGRPVPRAGRRRSPGRRCRSSPSRPRNRPCRGPCAGLRGDSRRP